MYVRDVGRVYVYGVCVCVCYCTCVEVRGQLTGINYVGFGDGSEVILRLGCRHLSILTPQLQMRVPLSLD